MTNVGIERATNRRVEQARLTLVSCYRKQKCDVTLPWDQNFWISTTFLDRDDHLHCPTMEEKYGLPFCS